MSRLWVTIQMRGAEVEEADLEFPFEADSVGEANWVIDPSFQRPGCQLLALPLVSDERPTFNLELEVVRE